MDAFNELRRKARERRDKAISEARDAYAATLSRITALEQDILGRDLSSHKTIAACIDSVIPTDRPFTTQDILIALETIDPRRNWRKRSLDSHLSRLRERKIVRRMKRAHGSQLAVYVRCGVEVEPLPFEGLTMKDVVEKVLSERGPMRQTELVQTMLGQGYPTTMTPKALRDAVGVVLRGDRRFREKTGMWILLDNKPN
jgi:hypothetical protein